MGQRERRICIGADADLSIGGPRGSQAEKPLQFIEMPMFDLPGKDLVEPRRMGFSEEVHQNPVTRINLTVWSNVTQLYQFHDLLMTVVRASQIEPPGLPITPDAEVLADQVAIPLIPCADHDQIALMDVEDQRAGFARITAEDSSLADNRASGAIERNSIN